LAGCPDDVEPRQSAALESAARGLALRELARMVVEPSPNDFPRLPVRQEPGTFVWLVGAPRPVDASLDSALADVIDTPVRTLMLEPTARSFLPMATP
jgi:hypothetical protein